MNEVIKVNGIAGGPNVINLYWPAGAMFWKNGELWRPAQDCSAGYGAALALCRVTRLDDTAFEQTVEAVLRPNEQWPGIGLHTVNEAPGFEVVDGCRARGT